MLSSMYCCCCCCFFPPVKSMQICEMKSADQAVAQTETSAVSDTAFSQMTAISHQHFTFKTANESVRKTIDWFMFSVLFTLCASTDVVLRAPVKWKFKYEKNDWAHRKFNISRVHFCVWYIFQLSCWSVKIKSGPVPLLSWPVSASDKCYSAGYANTFHFKSTCASWTAGKLEVQHAHAGPLKQCNVLLTPHLLKFPVIVWRPTFCHSSAYNLCWPHRIVS